MSQTRCVQSYEDFLKHLQHMGSEEWPLHLRLTQDEDPEDAEDLDVLTVKFPLDLPQLPQDQIAEPGDVSLMAVEIAFAVAEHPHLQAIDFDADKDADAVTVCLLVAICDGASRNPRLKQVELLGSFGCQIPQYQRSFVDHGKKSHSCAHQ